MRTKPIAVLVSDLRKFIPRYERRIKTFSLTTKRGTFLTGEEFVIIVDGPSAGERIMGWEFSAVETVGAISTRTRRLADERVR